MMLNRMSGERGDRSPVTGQSWRSLRTAAMRRLVPHGRRAQIRALYSRATWRLYVGNSVRCNCCGGNFGRFRDYISESGHHSRACPRCGALGRHRVDWLYLTDRTDVLQRPTNLLHIAPEVCLETPLRRMANIDYLSADYDSTLAMDQVDVRDIRYGDESFDGVICNHVLQLIDDDLTAMRELCRIVKPGGWALIQSSVNDELDDPLDRHVGDAVDEPPDRYEEVFHRIYGRADY